MRGLVIGNVLERDLWYLVWDYVLVWVWHGRAGASGVNAWMIEWVSKEFLVSSRDQNGV